MPKSKIDKLYQNPRHNPNNKSKPDKKTLDAERDMLTTARERARDGATYWKKNWDAAEDDLKFLGGEQWPSQIRTERELEQRPCLVNNVLPTFVDQVLGDQRQNRPSIKVSPVDSSGLSVPKGDGDGEGEEQETLKISNEAGNKDYEIGEVFTAYIKNIEYTCDAETSYDIAFQSAVESGMGYLRVLTDYVSDESFEQEIQIECIANQFAVTMDPNARKRDYHDMGWCLIDENMDKELFKEKYPNATADPVDDSTISDEGSWFSDKTVRVSEYFTREPVTRVAALMSDGSQYYIDEIEPIVDELMEKGIGIVRTRKVKTFKVIWRKISGYNLLEGPVEVACSTIPVVPVWGKALTIKNETIFRSLFRHSKDAQRMSNYWDSAGTETVALAPKSPFIGSEDHIEGREDEWKQANTKNLAILTYIPQYQGDPGPKRQPPAAVPAAEITLGMGATDKIKGTLGMFDASIGAQGNETSGRAILARQREADVGTYTFIDNLSKAIRRVGKIIVEMAPKIVDTERVIRLKFPDETEDFVTLNKKILDDETNEWITINDLSIAKYDVVVRTGPAYTTQRMEAAESMIAFAQAVPAAAGVMADLIAQNMDWPGSEAIAARLKKIVPPNVLSSDEREKLKEDMPEEQEPTPEQQIEMEELNARKAEAGAKVAQAEADTVEAEADVLKAQLESAEAQRQLAVIENGATGGDEAYQQVKQMVAQAIAEAMAAAQAGAAPE